jgi:hypothetical protein
MKDQLTYLMNNFKTEVDNLRWHKIKQAIEENHTVPTIPESTELTIAGIVTDNPELTVPIESTAP